MSSLFNKILTMAENKYIVRHTRIKYPEKKDKQYRELFKRHMRDLEKVYYVYPDFQRRGERECSRSSVGRDNYQEAKLSYQISIHIVE